MKRALVLVLVTLIVVACGGQSGSSPTPDDSSSATTDPPPATTTTQAPTTTTLPPTNQQATAALASEGAPAVDLGEGPAAEEPVAETPVEISEGQVSLAEVQALPIIKDWGGRQAIWPGDPVPNVDGPWTGPAALFLKVRSTEANMLLNHCDPSLSNCDHRSPPPSARTSSLEVLEPLSLQSVQGNRVKFDGVVRTADMYLTNLEFTVDGELSVSLEGTLSRKHPVSRMVGSTLVHYVNL